MGAKHFPTRSSYESTHLEFATLKKMRCVLLSSESHMFPRKLTWETSRSKLKKQTQTKRTRAPSVQNCSLTGRVRHPDGINVGLLGSVWRFLSMSGPSLLAQSNHALEETGTGSYYPILCLRSNGHNPWHHHQNLEVLMSGSTFSQAIDLVRWTLRADPLCPCPPSSDESWQHRCQQ